MATDGPATTPSQPTHTRPRRFVRRNAVAICAASVAGGAGSFGTTVVQISTLQDSLKEARADLRDLSKEIREKFGEQIHALDKRTTRLETLAESATQKGPRT